MSRVLKGIAGFFVAVAIAAPIGATVATGTAGAVAGHALRPFLQAPHTFPPVALTFTVNTTTDTSDATPGDGVCADGSGKCSVRAAVEEANADNKTVNVVIPAGNYSLTLGQLSATDTVGVQLSGTGTVNLAASGANRVLEVQQGSSTVGAFVSLNNVVVTGGNPAANGGGILINDSNDTLTIANSVISTNAAGTGNIGGGVYNNGAFWATNTTFSGNTAKNGGGLYNNDGSSRLSHDTFSANTVTADGGGVFNENGPVSIDNSTFTGNMATTSTNTAVGGGGLYADDETELTSDLFTGNQAVAGGTANAEGGGIYDEYGLNSMTGTTVSGNVAQAPTTNIAEGGGIYDNNAITISQSTISGNSAVNGSGGGIFEDSDGLLLQSSLISGNSATGSTSSSQGFGGGMAGCCIVNVNASRITNNHADVGGGGFRNFDGAILTNSTIDHNTSNVGAGIEVGWGLQATSDAIVDNTASGPSNAGGGIFTYPGSTQSPHEHADLQSVTIAGNVADTGAGIAIGTMPNLTGGGQLANDTVAGNLTSAGAEQDCGVLGAGASNLYSSAGGNVIGDNTCGFTVSSDRQGAGQQGYWEVASDGGIFSYNTSFLGSTGSLKLNKPIVGMAHTPGNQGYWLVASDGGIFSFGDAQFYGSTGALSLNKPIVGMASTPDGKGYWLVASDGGIFSFGDATFFGSTGAIHLNKPIVGMAVTPDGQGYWLVASDGGIFSFGDAQFFGSTGALTLNKPIVGMSPATDGFGYYLVASDGGVFTFGSAHFAGSTGAIKLNKPIVGMATSPDNVGYWLFASDGGVFTFGNAKFQGSTGGSPINKPVVGGAAT